MMQKDAGARQQIEQLRKDHERLRGVVKYLLYAQRDLLKANGVDTTGVDGALAKMEEREAAK